MLGWFLPRCPVSTQDKVWVERRMLWLVDKFGIERLRDTVVVLPTPEFFPDPYQGDEPSAHACFKRVCQYMGVDASAVSLVVSEDWAMPDAAGLYEQQLRSNIYISRSQLVQPTRLLATLAHELAHEILLKGSYLTREASDHEAVTDLLPVFLGLGIFAANATVESTTFSAGQMTYFSINRQGYLSSIVIGYALAVFAFLREERHPLWARHLRTDARVSLREGLRYLYRTGDTIIAPSRVHGIQPTPNTDAITAHLSHRSPTYRLSALRDVFELDTPPAELLESVILRLKDSNQDVQYHAITAIGRFGQAASVAVPDLIMVCWYGEARMRLAAVNAIGTMAVCPGQVVPVLASMLAEKSEDVVAAAASALANFRDAAESAVPQLLQALERSASVNNAYAIDALITSIQAICIDPIKRIRSYFKDRDADVRRLVVAHLRDHEL